MENEKVGNDPDDIDSADGGKLRQKCYEYNDPLLGEEMITEEETQKLVEENMKILDQNLNAFKLGSHTGLGKLKNRLRVNNEEVSEKKEPETEEVKEGLASWIVYSLENFIGGCVKQLNETTADQYIDFIEKNYPVDEEDWNQIKTKIRHKDIIIIN